MKKFFGLFLLMLGFVLAGCSDDDKMSLGLINNGIEGLNGNTLTVANMNEDKTVEIPLKGVTGQVSVSPVSYDPDNGTEDGWLSAEAKETAVRSTDSDWKIILKIEAYYQEKNRKAQVTITSGDDELILEVIQTGIADQTEMVIVCEGQFGKGNAAISTIKYNGELAWDIYQDVNKQALGDIAQSLTWLDGKYFVTLSNSQMIRIVEPGSFKRIKTIEDKTRPFSPQYMVPLNDKEALVSDLNQQLVKINYKDYTIVEYIDLSSTGISYIQEMTRVGNKIFCTVLMPDGTYMGSQIWIYDINNFKPLEPKVISIQNIPPSSRAVEDKNGKLWVLGVNGETGNPTLYCIDPQTEKIDTDASFEIRVQAEGDEGYAEGAITGVPGWNNRLETDRAKEKLYLMVNTWADKDNKMADAVYSFDVNARKLERYRLTPGLQTANGMNISPDGEVYLCDALDYQQRGYLRRYKADGTVENIKVGVIPRTVHFTEYDK